MSPYYAFEGKNKIEKFIEMSQVGIVTPQIHVHWREDGSWKLVPKFKDDISTGSSQGWAHVVFHSRQIEKKST